MKTKNKRKRLGTSLKTLNRRELIKQEIYGILHTEAHKWFELINSREETAMKRLNSMEQSAMPYNAVEEIKSQISRLSYTISKNTRAIESLLGFFNATKGFLNEQEENKKL